MKKDNLKAKVAKDKTNVKDLIHCESMAQQTS